MEKKNTKKKTLSWLYVLRPEWQKRTAKAKPHKQTELPNVTWVVRYSNIKTVNAFWVKYMDKINISSQRTFLVI